MTIDTRMKMHRGAAALVAIALLAAGAGVTYLLMRSEAGGRVVEMSPPTGAQPSPPASAPSSNAPLSDVIVPLSQNAVERAGIVVAPVASGTSATEIRLPGVVEPNSYRQVVVTPLVAGRLTKVGPALGDRVRRGQTLAEIYSPALAEAQTRYVSAQAMLDGQLSFLIGSRRLAALRHEIDAAADDASLLRAAERLHVGNRLAAREQARSGHHRGQRVEDVMLSLLGHRGRERFARRLHNIVAQLRHHRRQRLPVHGMRLPPFTWIDWPVT